MDGIKGDNLSLTVEKCKKAFHEELCDKALEHYLEISSECMHYNSVVEDAIKFYKKYGNKFKNIQ